MGDRGNILMRYDSETAPKDVYLYTHWGGANLPGVVHTVLTRKQRWGDASYLARMMFCEMIRESDDFSGETGYGISPTVTDNEHDFLMIDVDAQEVQRVNPDSGTVMYRWAFTDYIALNIEEAEELKDF